MERASTHLTTATIALLLVMGCSTAPEIHGEGDKPLTRSAAKHRGAVLSTGARAFREASTGWVASYASGLAHVHETGELRLVPSDDGPPLHLRTEWIRRGSRDLVSLGDVTLEDEGLRIARGGAVERFRVGPRALEQTWEFPARPAGRGDLEVRVALSGFVPERSGAAGIILRAGDHEAVYGHGTWIDAGGQRAPVPALLDGSGITLRVPAALVDESAYPVVLDPIITPPVRIDESARGISGSPAGVAVAGNGSDYMVVWTVATVDADAPMLVGARYDETGATLSAEPIRILDGTATSLPPHLVRGGSGYLAVWGSKARVIPDGATMLTTPVVDLSTPGGRTTAWWDGSAYHVAWGSWSIGLRSIRIDAAGNPIDLVPRTLATSIDYPHVGCGPSGCLVTFWVAGGLYASRFLPDGTLRDSPPIAVAVPGEFAMSYVVGWGTGWLVVWLRNSSTGPHTLYTARIAADGTVVEQTSVPVPPEQVLRVDDVVASGGDLALLGRRAESSFLDEARALLVGYPLVIRGAVGFRTSNLAVIRGASNGGPFFVVDVGTNAMATRDVLGRTVSATGAAGTPFVVNRGRPRQVEPAVAFDGTQYLAVWVDERNGNPDIYGARVGADGTVLDSPAIPIAEGPATESAPSVTAHAGGFYVAWVSRSSTANSVMGARVSSAGTVVDVGGRILDALPTDVIYSSYGLSVSSTGSVALAVWCNASLQALLIDSTGAFGPIFPTGLSCTAGASSRTSGTDFLVSAALSGNDAFRRFSLSGAPLEPARYGPCSDGIAEALWNGTTYVHICDDGRMRGLDGTTGTIPVPWRRDLNASFDGFHQVTATILDGFAPPAYGIGVWRTRTSGDLVGTMFSLLPSDAGPTGVPGMASDGLGRTLFVYQQTDPYDAVAGAEVRAQLVSFLGDASPCLVDGDCRSGFCVDGVCCDSACGGTSTNDCQACRATAGASADGVCSPIASGLVCRAAAGSCDAPEICDGSSFYCPSDTYRAGTVVCRIASGPCDVEERCTGYSPLCPTDERSVSGVVCRASTGPCDPADTCDGSSTSCIDTFLPDGSRCDDSLACNGRESCAAGACTSSAPLDCDDGNPCTADSCDEAGGCRSEHISGCCVNDLQCNDADPCTDDACVANACTFTPAAACIDGGASPRDAGDGPAGDGGPVTEDAGENVDASPPPSDSGWHDAAEPDAGPGEPTGDSGGEGCGCSAQSGGNASGLLLILLALAFSRRRRPGLGRSVGLVLVAIVCVWLGLTGCGDERRVLPDASTPLDATVTDASTSDSSSPRDAGDPADAWAPPDAAARDAATGDAGDGPDGGPSCTMAAPDRCATGCTDLRTDESNCGACGDACPSGIPCIGAVCRCPAGTRACAGACVDTLSSPTHCGACGVSCAADEACMSGRCQCSAGGSLCAGTCVSTATDPLHCGACGNACPPSATCVGGTCTCPSGLVDCGDACSDLTTASHCGACDVRCATGAACISGSCYCPGGGTICSGTCRQLDADEDHCGACDRVCPTGATCVGGSCTCSGSLTLCASGCVDVSSDASNCGVCGNLCAAGTSCISGVCGCPAGSALCGGTCADLQTDEANCGSCGTSCPLLCRDGECTTAVVSVAAGHVHTCALVAEGYVYCFGGNVYGQLGFSTSPATSTATPRTIAGLDRIVQIALGSEHTCALRADGVLWCWGRNDRRQVSLVPGYRDVHPTPQRAPVANVVAMSAGGSNTCAIDSTGYLYCWGDNTYGQLGTGSMWGSAYAARVLLPARAVSVAVAATHVCALLEDATVVCWGAAGTAGDGTTASRSAPGSPALISNVAEIRAGFGFSCARRTDGTGACWGLNNYGQVGDGTTTDRPAPVVLAGISTMAALHTGHSHGCALLADGTSRCWGLNHLGQFGDGTRTSSLWPTAMTALTGIRRMGLGSYHGCAILSDTDTRCWGFGTAGQLGQGSVSSNVPLAVGF